jgi:hypothetical protein
LIYFLTPEWSLMSYLVPLVPLGTSCSPKMKMKILSNDFPHLCFILNNLSSRLRPTLCVGSWPRMKKKNLCQEIDRVSSCFESLPSKICKILSLGVDYKGENCARQVNHSHSLAIWQNYFWNYLYDPSPLALQCYNPIICDSWNNLHKKNIMGV